MYTLFLSDNNRHFSCKTSNSFKKNNYAFPKNRKWYYFTVSFSNLTCVLIEDSWTFTSAFTFNLLQYAILAGVNEENETGL